MRVGAEARESVEREGAKSTRERERERESTKHESHIMNRMYNGGRLPIYIGPKIP